MGWHGDHVAPSRWVDAQGALCPAPSPPLDGGFQSDLWANDCLGGGKKSWCQNPATNSIDDFHFLLHFSESRFLVPPTTWWPCVHGGSTGDGEHADGDAGSHSEDAVEATGTERPGRAIRRQNGLQPARHWPVVDAARAPRGSPEWVQA